MISACSTLVLVMLLTPLQGADQRAEAERLASAGSHREALVRFQALAAANPDDIEARLWIGRMHAALGHPRRAIDVFRAILAVQPEHLPAMIELGSALVGVGDYREAGRVLDRAEALAPDNPAILTAQGRRHGSAGQRELARAYFNRAQAIEPGHAAARQAGTALRAANAHRIEAGYLFEDFDRDIESTHAGDLAINLRVNDTLRLFAAGQRQRKFARVENRAGGGFEWTARRGLRVRAGGLFGGDAIVLPESDAFGEVSADAGRATWTFLARYADFDAASLWLGGAELLVRLPRGFEARASYLRSTTDPEEDAARSEGLDSGTIGLSGRLGTRARLSGAYTRGLDHLELLTADRLGLFTADTWSAGLDVSASPLLSFALTYDYQSRPAGIHVHRAGVRLIQRF